VVESIQKFRALKSPLLTLLELPLLGLLDLGELSRRLVAQASAAPVLPDLVGTLVVVGGHGLGQLVQGATVSRLNTSDGHAGGGLPASDATQPRLVLDNAVGHAHLTAQGGQEQNKLQRIDVIGNDDELGFLLLHEGGHGVDAVTNHRGPLGRSILLSLSLGDSASPQPLLLGLLVLRTILVQQLEQLGGFVCFKVVL